MNNVTIATTAVAGPPSFVGMEWLLVANLCAATLGLLIFSFAARMIWRAWLADRVIDPRGSAPEIARRIIGLLLTGETMRCLSDAFSLYGWNPATQSAGGWATVGRFLDPAGLALMIVATVIWLLTEDGLMGQLRTPPPYSPLWEDRETKVRLCLFALIALGLALCPVIFR